MAACCSRSVQISTPCHFQRPVFVGSTSTSICRSWRYAASPPNILFVKNVGRPAKGSRIHSLSNVFKGSSFGRAAEKALHVRLVEEPGGIDHSHPRLEHACRLVRPVPDRRTQREEGRWRRDEACHGDVLFVVSTRGRVPLFL